MILDNETLFADKLAFDGVAKTIELGSVKPEHPGAKYKGGPGKPIKCFIQGSADLAGVTGIDLLHTGNDNGNANNGLLFVDGNPAGTIIEFDMPSTTLRFVTAALAGTPTAGTWTCGIVLEGNQTNP